MIFANTNAGGGGGTTTISKTRTQLTDAQVKALPTTGVDVVAAPGAGSILVPIMAVLYLDWTANYTNINANCMLAIWWSSITWPAFSILHQGAGANQLLVGLGLLANSKDTVCVMHPIGYNDPFRTEEFAQGRIDYANDMNNLALTLKVNNGGSGNFTGGNAANVLYCDVYYGSLSY